MSTFDDTFHLIGQAPKPVRLSKSRFIAGVQCLKRLYLQTYPPEPETPAAPAPQEQLDQGHRVGELAQTAFPGGVLVANSALAETAALIDNPAVPAIFEAAFRFDGIIVRVDILQRQPGNSWRLIEVKSST